MIEIGIAILSGIMILIMIVDRNFSNDRGRDLNFHERLMPYKLITTLEVMKSMKLIERRLYKSPNER